MFTRKPLMAETYPAQILLFSDLEPHGQALQAALSQKGYEVRLVEHSEQGMVLLRQTPPDLVILESYFGNWTGVEVCRQIRRSGHKLLPVVLMHTEGSVEKRAEGIDAGASDYIVKPFSTDDLLMCITSQLRRYRAQNKVDKVLQCNDLSLNPKTHEVERSKRPIELTGKEYELLKFLMLHPREVLSREQILKEVWGEDFAGESNIIEVYIRYLRIKLDGEGEKKLIQTVRGVGYILRD
jgi:two-component system OmpR family response regulator